MLKTNGELHFTDEFLENKGLAKRLRYKMQYWGSRNVLLMSIHLTVCVVCMCVHVYVCSCGGQRLTAVSQMLPTLFRMAGLLTSLVLPD